MRYDFDTIIDRLDNARRQHHREPSGVRRGFNNFVPDKCAAILRMNKKYIERVFWDDRDDSTILVLPKLNPVSTKSVQEYELENMGHQMGADEVDFDSLEHALETYGIYNTPRTREQLRYDALDTMTPGDGTDLLDVLRIWFD